MNPLAADALAQRLDRMERENRYLRWIGAALLVGVGLLATIGPWRGSDVRGRQFELRDDKGQVRARLGFNVYGAPGLEFFDTQGSPQIALLAEESTSNFHLSQRGAPRVSLTATADGASTLHLFDQTGNAPSSLYMWPEGSTGLFLSGRESPLHLTARAEGPGRLAVLDGQYQEKASLWFTGEGPMDWRQAATMSVGARPHDIASERTIDSTRPAAL